MKRITLVNVAYPEEGRPPSWLPPIGLLYIASVLEKNGWRVDFRDFQLEGVAAPRPDDLIHFLEGAADIIGISCLSNGLPLVCLTVKQLKNLWPDKIVILGGVGPSLVAENLIRCFPEIDVLVRGEGEITIIELLNALISRDNLSEIHGILYREGSDIRATSARTRINDLDSLPFPAYHLLDFPRFEFTSPQLGALRVAGMSTARGCLYRCIFCANAAMWPGGTRFRSVNNVLAELRLLVQQYDRNFVFFAVDNFVAHREIAMHLCERLKQEFPDIQWSCPARVDHMDQELMRAMADAGCVAVQYGIESGSNQVLRKVGKNFTVKKALKVIADSVKFFPEVKASFIWGFPFESMEDFYDTIVAMKIVSELGAVLNFVFLEPEPNTPIFEAYKDKLRMLNSLPPEICPRPYYNQEMVDFIISHPSVFSNLFYITGDNLSEKTNLLHRYGIFDKDQSHFKLPLVIENEEKGIPVNLAMEVPLSLNKNICLRNVGGKNYVYDIDNSATYELNETALKVFEGCITGKTPSHIVTRFVKEYRVTSLQSLNLLKKALNLFFKKGWIKT